MKPNTIIVIVHCDRLMKMQLKTQNSESILKICGCDKESQGWDIRELRFTLDKVMGVILITMKLNVKINVGESKWCEVRHF